MSAEIDTGVLKMHKIKYYSFQCFFVANIAKKRQLPQLPTDTIIVPIKQYIL